MLKRFVCLAVGSVVVLAVAGVAYGAAVKIRAFIPTPQENQNADGMAILNYASGQDKTIVQIIISDFEPDRTIDGGDAYTVEFVSDTHTARGTYDIETDRHGHGTLHLTLGVDPRYPEQGGDWSDSDLNIYVNFGHPQDEELRATGTNPG